VHFSCIQNIYIKLGSALCAGKLIDRFIELIKKNFFFKDNQTKTPHSKMLIESSESIITNQNSYLKWLIKNKVISNEDLTKHFSLFGKIETLNKIHFPLVEFLYFQKIKQSESPINSIRTNRLAITSSFKHKHRRLQLIGSNFCSK
jgi:hypothetical protein